MVSVKRIDTANSNPSKVIPSPSVGLVPYMLIMINPDTIPGLDKERFAKPEDRIFKVLAVHLSVETEAIPQRVVDVVTLETNARAENIQRVQPLRFDVDLERNVTLRYFVKDSAASQTITNEERMRDLWKNVSSLGSHLILRFPVSAEGAQTAFYSLKPGTGIEILRVRPEDRRYNQGTP